jgi:hypothetical protein
MPEKSTWRGLKLASTRIGIDELDFHRRLRAELHRSYAKHGRDQWGRHEFYAILKEEVDELWDAIKEDLPQANVEHEAIQVATMVLRYMETGDKYRDPVR